MKQNRLDELPMVFYKTTDFALACFLYIKGIEMKGMEKGVKENEMNFVFKQSQRCEELVDAWQFSARNNPDLWVDPREFWQMTKEFKSKIYNG